MEIEWMRRAEAAHMRLHAFVPEPPYGEAAVRELRECEMVTEECRATLDATRKEFKSHLETHALTLSR